MPPPFEALSKISRLPEETLSRQVDDGSGSRPTIQFVLYDLLRSEQALLARSEPSGRTEMARILDLAQKAYGELVGVLAGGADDLLDSARDGEWSLRDLLRHAIAVELRYAAQIEYSANRADDEPLAIPSDRLPSDRLSPPEPVFGDSRVGGVTRVLELLGKARATSDQRLNALSEDALARPSLWGTHETNVRMRSHQIAAHLTEVVVQCEKLLAPHQTNGEARRILRHCCATRGTHERWSPHPARAALDERYRRLADSSVSSAR